ncbi:RDD family protein [Salicibibacter cibarius]|nr:RDD family protein [Salicibibacter cibarius]
MVFRGKRLLAGLIDFIIVTLLVNIPFPIFMETGLEGWFLVYLLIIFIGYGYILEGRNNQTVGKKVMGLKVVSSKTGKSEIFVWQLLIRNVFRPLDYIGFWGVIPITLFKRRLGEFLSLTEVRENPRVSSSKGGTKMNEKSEK